MVVGYVTVSPIAYLSCGMQGLISAAVAVTVCLIAGTSALITHFAFSAANSQNIMYGFLIGMTLRMFLPLASAVAVYLRRGMLVDAGMVYYLILFYIIMLATEVALILPSTQSKPSTHSTEPCAKAT